MKLKKIVSLTAALSMLVSGIVMPTAVKAETAEQIPAYLDESRSFEERAADLVSRMTLEEKVSQLGYTAPAIERLGVSRYNYWRECLHGVARQGVATNFPAPLALSNTWNRELVNRAADIISTEARGKNNKTDLSYYTPTINMARDPRWGRNEESYGEDAYLTGELAGEFVKGMQGEDEKYVKIIATIKHFAANNNEKDRRGGSSIMSEYNFRNYYLKPFQNVAAKEMPGSVMSSYNATSIYRNGEMLYNYLPSAANTYLLTDILRRTWGFDGYVTTDCGAGSDLITNEAYKSAVLGMTDADNGAYIAAALKAGMDLECNLSGGNAAQSYGANAVMEGYISEQELETNVYHLFLQRFRTGEFDKSPSYRDITSSVIETDENVAVAEEAAEESWVLLKNEGDFLPLEGVKKAAVVGSFADKLVLGDYTGTPTKNVTPIEGISAELAKQGAQTEHLGAVAEDEKLFNVKSITLVLKDGKTRAVDLSKAQSVSGMGISSGVLTDVTPKAAAVIPNVNFQDVVSVRAEIAQGAQMGGTLNIGYGSGGTITVASIASQATSSTSEYVICEGEYTGEDGGYNGVADLTITAAAAVAPFSVAEYKVELDEADVIIAYAATIPKQEGMGDPDASESRDRASINLPIHQSHVQEICDAYPEKTVVVMSTVGQMNVEPFMDKCKAILWTSYNGQTQGTALGRVLTGAVNPSGRLTTTWYKNSDVEKMELSHHVKESINGISGYYTNYDIQPTDSKSGNTYQYYKNTPVYPFGYGLSYTNFAYSNIKADTTAADANGKITFSADVTNTGATTGKETVQLYIAPPQTDANVPKKQLKNFEKIELAPNETKTVNLSLNIADLALYSESLGGTAVAEGEYTAYIGKSADDMSNAVKFTVSGTLKSELKTVKAMPDGITLNGYICEDGSGLEKASEIHADLSAVMSDESFYDLSNAKVEYISADSEIAEVSADGTVKSGTKSGVTTITASVTVDGVTVSDSFPVVNALEIKPTDAEIAAAQNELKAEYDKLPKDAYSDANKAELEKAYNAALANIAAAKTKAAMEKAVEDAITALKSVAMDKLTVAYTIEALNPNYLQDGVIDYREGGIEPYQGAYGTITNANPSAPIALTVKDENGKTVNGAVWQLRRIDGSSREAARIDSATGELTVYGNGIIELTAADASTLKCAKQTIYINMQIEGEYADDNGGANLNDAQSGSSGGKDAGSTGNAWLLYKSVKVKNLESVTMRFAGKNAGLINISLAPEAAADKLLASYSASATGGWNKWTEQSIAIDTDKANRAADENGCADVYIQTNGINLDYFKLAYVDTNDEVPYVIEELTNKNGGVISAAVKYRGSALAAAVVLKAELLNADKSVKKTTETSISGSDVYDVNTGAAEGESVRFTVCAADGKALSESVETVYRVPVASEVVIHGLDNTDYDYSVLTGGADNTAYTAEVNGLSGYGAWALQKVSEEYTYTDVNGEKYECKFTKAWKAGKGTETNRSLYFTPKSECKVTAVFKGGDAARSMKIAQNGTVLTEQPGTGSVAAAVAEITDLTSPVYIYGGSSNKELYAVIVEYYGKSAEPTVEPTIEPTAEPTAEPTIEPTQAPEYKGVAMSYENGKLVISSDTEMNAVLLKAAYDADGRLTGIAAEEVSIFKGETEITPEITGKTKLMLWSGLGEMQALCEAAEAQPYSGDDIALQYIDWGEKSVVLTENDVTGETTVWNVLNGEQRVPLQTDVFFESDVPHNYGDKYRINALAVYKDRLYAGCDGGLVIMFTDCAKCYKLKKAWDRDIKEMSIVGGVMHVTDGESEADIDMSTIGGDSIERDEALTLLQRGAVLVDVRTEEEFAQDSAAESVNLPLSELENGLKAYEKDAVIIFVCGSGMRAQKAVEIAKTLGYTKVYCGGRYSEF